MNNNRVYNNRVYNNSKYRYSLADLVESMRKLLVSSVFVAVSSVF